jgi:hypothetical protein
VGWQAAGDHGSGRRTPDAQPAGSALKDLALKDLVLKDLVLKDLAD